MSSQRVCARRPALRAVVRRHVRGEYSCKSPIFIALKDFIEYPLHSPVNVLSLPSNFWAEHILRIYFLKEEACVPQTYMRP